ncbi:MAG: transposase, partial [Bifidobacterium sp.]|nr:transposase [Bifidobacterium sp.]
IGETTAYLLPEFPTEHRRRIRTNNMIERLNREIRRRTRVVGSFPDGKVVPEKLRTLDHGRPWSDDQFASTRLSSNRDMSR